MALESCADVCVVDFNEHIVSLESRDVLTILLQFIPDYHWNILYKFLVFL